MIALYDNTLPTPGRLAMTYNGLTLNNPADTKTDTYEINDAVIRQMFDYVSEPNQQRDGLEVYEFRKQSTLILLKCTIRSTTRAGLMDKIKALAAAFDPATIGHLNGADDMFLAFDFSVPTLDTANYASGLVPSRYYALPLATPLPAINYATGLSAFVDIQLICRDPRRYLQTAVDQSGAGTIANSKANYRSWPTLVLTMSGAGSASFQIQNTPATPPPGITSWSLVLDLSSAVNGEVITVDMENRKITSSLSSSDKTGTFFKSGAWLEIEPGNNVIAYTNGSTGITSKVLSFRPAFSA